MIRAKRIQSLRLATEYRRFLDAACGPLLEIAVWYEFDALGVQRRGSKEERQDDMGCFHCLRVQFFAQDVLRGQPKA